MKKLLVILFFILNVISVKAQWNEILKDSTYWWLSDVKFINNDTGYVCGALDKSPYCGIILKTTNGGITWDTSQLYCFAMISLSIAGKDVIYASGQDAGIFKSIDGGQTWSWDRSIPGCCDDLSTIYFLNPDTGFAVRFNAGIWRTQNGTKWDYQISGGHAYFMNTSSIQFINDSIGFVAFEKVYKTSNYGNTWQKLNVDSNMNATCLYMKNLNEGIVIGLKGKVALTFDGGTTWTPTVTITPYSLFDAAFINDSIGYIVGGDEYYDPNSVGKIFVTTDRGYTWNLIQTCDRSLTSLYFVNDSIGYAVGQGGRIYKISNANTLGINQFTINHSISVSPNPATTHLTVSTNTNTPSEIILYDITSRKLMEEKFINEVSLNIAPLAKGVYLYQITDAEGMVSRGKVIKQ